MRQTLRTLRWSAWLGWQIEANWTNPWLFAIYVVAKPLAAALLLVFMFRAADAALSGDVRPGLLAFAYVGNAAFMLIAAVGRGMSGAVVADREQYGMLKYLRISPAGLRAYLVGRGLAGGSVGLLGALCILSVAGVGPLGVRAALAWEQVAWGWLALYLAIGLVMLLALGLILSGCVLDMARHGTFLSEGVGGGIYLLSGAVIPLDVLPRWAQPLSLALPTTYWLEGVRLAVLGPTSLRVLPAWGHAELALALAGSTAVLVLAAHLVFSWGERRAQRLGRFDQTTGY